MGIFLKVFFLGEAIMMCIRLPRPFFILCSWKKIKKANAQKYFLNQKHQKEAMFRGLRRKEAMKEEVFFHTSVLETRTNFVPTSIKIHKDWVKIKTSPPSAWVAAMRSVQQ